MLPNAGLAIGNLRRAGYRIVVVTNQSPIGRGHWDSDNLDDIHSELRNRLLIEDPDAHLDLILFSPYAPWEGAWARKPNSGMLEAGRQLIEAASNNVDFTSIELLFDTDGWKGRMSQPHSWWVIEGLIWPPRRTSVSEGFVVIQTSVSQGLSIRYWGVPRERYRRERCHPDWFG